MNEKKGLKEKNNDKGTSPSVHFPESSPSDSLVG